MSPEGSSTERYIDWRDASGSIQRIQLESRDFSIVPGSGWSASELRRQAPSLLAAMPFVVSFNLTLDFESNEAAAQYWPEETQARRRQLLAKQGGK